MFFETIIIWMEDVDLSNVFKTEDENIVRRMANLELFSTLPNIAYLFLVYFFIVDIREFYMNQDGTIQEFIVSIYTIQSEAFLTYWINWINNLFIGWYALVWTGINITVLPIKWFNQAV